MADADAKITDLPAFTDASVLDVFEIVDVSADVNEKITLAQLLALISGGYFARLPAARTLTSTTADQAIFDAANDTLTLELGTYTFDALIALTAMSATSGNARFQLVGAGTAVLADQLFHIVGVDGAAATTATQTGSTAVSNSSPAAAVTAGTGTAMTMNIRGTFEVTTAGTIIPSIALLTAAAAVVTAGSYIRIAPIGANGVASFGPWT